ncbi:hypothetical protein [Brevundimonas fluminis]|uniref:hypothetical protein n=1 Tax=Brevundimonas fluminis TaxID=2487274 RepID=UPI000F65657A|nr:hypothetical protein [Brevundimonas fluminis]
MRRLLEMTLALAAMHAPPCLAQSQLGTAEAFRQSKAAFEQVRVRDDDRVQSYTLIGAACRPTLVQIWSDGSTGASQPLSLEHATVRSYEEDGGYHTVEFVSPADGAFTFSAGSVRARTNVEAHLAFLIDACADAATRSRGASFSAEERAVDAFQSLKLELEAIRRTAAGLDFRYTLQGRPCQARLVESHSAAGQPDGRTVSPVEWRRATAEPYLVGPAPGIRMRTDGGEGFLWVDTEHRARRVSHLMTKLTQHCQAVGGVVD